MLRIKFFHQLSEKDCGLACIKMITNFYGRNFSDFLLREKTYITKTGVSFLGIIQALEFLGLDSLCVETNVETLYDNKENLPAILHWRKNHFVVLYDISMSFITNKKTYKVADPAHGYISLSETNFKGFWSSKRDNGIALFIEPTENFYKQDSSKENLSIRQLFRYLNPYKKQLTWLFNLLLLGTVTTLVFPILTQKLIDDGVNKKNLSVITYILLAQLAFFFGNIIFGIFRNWIMLVMGTKINIQIISDFLKKLLKLPIKFFDTKLMGDFNQRIQDHERIENFLTSQSLLNPICS
jgi:ATP-binding cassette subfamily B protein